MTHPERLGKYQITGVLGEGAMGVVYRGFDPDIRRVVALKTIRRPAGESQELAAELAARFRNEAQAAGRLQHPGIVGVYDFGDDGQVAYIAMEYVEGHTLSHYLNKKVQFSQEDVASVIVQLLGALNHAHEHGVWHRDIKPANVIMTRSGLVKIADFGIARIDSAALTMGAALIGTPSHMAPEQFLGLPIDHRVDLYATGVLLYQLIAGRTPFVGSTEALMYKVVHELPQPPSEVATAANPPRDTRFDAAAAKALAKDPAQRFASAAAFREAMVEASAQAVRPSVSEATVVAVPLPQAYAPTVRITPASAGGGSPSSASGAAKVGTGSGGTARGTADGSSHWDNATLAQAEHSLARHVGPLAGVLVRRAARDCQDLPSLYARLAEQISNPAAREAFVGQASRSGVGTVVGHGTHAPGTSSGLGSGLGSGVGGRGSGGGGGLTAPPVSVPVSDEWLAQAQQLLAQQLGPIARVVVKKAAERSRERHAVCAALLDAVPESARAKLGAGLAKLG